MVISGNEARKRNIEEGSYLEDDKGGNSSDNDDNSGNSSGKAGTVKNGGSLVVDSVWGTKAPFTPLDRENPKGLVGTGKIVGNSAFIIMNDNYNKPARSAVSENIMGSSCQRVPYPPQRFQEILLEKVLIQRMELQEPAESGKLCQ